jgi:hypothetical protein
MQLWLVRRAASDRRLETEIARRLCLIPEIRQSRVNPDLRPNGPRRPFSIPFIPLDRASSRVAGRIGKLPHLCPSHFSTKSRGAPAPTARQAPKESKPLSSSCSATPNRPRRRERSGARPGPAAKARLCTARPAASNLLRRGRARSRHQTPPKTPLCRPTSRTTSHRQKTTRLPANGNHTMSGTQRVSGSVITENGRKEKNYRVS